MIKKEKQWKCLQQININSWVKLFRANGFQIPSSYSNSKNHFSLYVCFLIYVEWSSLTGITINSCVTIFWPQCQVTVRLIICVCYNSYFHFLVKIKLLRNYKFLIINKMQNKRFVRMSDNVLLHLRFLTCSMYPSWMQVCMALKNKNKHND